MKESMDIVDKLGKVVGNKKLDPFVWETPFSQTNFSLVYYWQNAKKKASINEYYETKKNKREVSGGGRKPRKQKGLGMARQGSIRSPQWRKGGVVFGPTGDKKHQPKMNKKSRKEALKSLLSWKLNNDKIKVIQEEFLDSYKTKEANNLLINLNLKKKVLLVLPEKDDKKEIIFRSFCNLQNIKVVDSSFLNIIDVNDFDNLLLTEKSLEEIENKFKNKKI